MKKTKIIAMLLSLSIVLTSTSCKDNTSSSSKDDADASTASSDIMDTSGDEGASTVESADASGDNNASGTSSTGSKAASSQKTSSKSTSSKSTSSAKPPAASDNWGVDETNKSPDPLEQGVDLKGYKFKVIGNAGDQWSRKTGVSTSDDIRVKMLNNIETKLNCKIECTQAAAGTIFSTYQPKILSGEKVADIFTPTMWEAGSFISAGLLTPFNEIKNVNMTRPYWNQNFAKVATIGGKQYAANSSFGPHLFAETAIVFNKRIAEEMNLDLYKMVKEGKWTIDAFSEMCKNAYKDIDGQAGRTDNDRYGLAAPAWTKSIGLYCGSGIKILDTVGSKVVFNFKPSASSASNADAITYMKKLKDICVKGTGCSPIKETTNWAVALDLFAAGKSLFFLQMVGTISNPDYKAKFKNMKDDFGVLPVPNYKGGTVYNNLVDWNSEVWIVPITNKDTAKTGIILEALAYHGYYDYSNANINEWCNKNLRDQDSVEMMKILQENPYYDLVFIAGTSNEKISDAINRIVVMSSENAGYDPAQAIPMYENSIRTNVDKFFNS